MASVQTRKAPTRVLVKLAGRPTTVWRVTYTYHSTITTVTLQS